MGKVVVVFCEGDHDIALLSRLLFVNGYKPYGKKVKDNHYKEKVEKAGFNDFTSVVTDHFGAWNQDGIKFIKILGACLNEVDSLHWNKKKGTKGYQLFYKHRMLQWLDLVIMSTIS